MVLQLAFPLSLPLISLPTFFITECVLVYMDPTASERLIKWAGSNFRTAAFLNYDPVCVLFIVTLCYLYDLLLLFIDPPT